MLFSWLQSCWRSQPRRPSVRAPRPRFRPTVLALEDRMMPSGTGLATHLEVSVPEGVNTGSTFSILVEAEDASNQVASGFTGTVSLVSSDMTATGTALPGSTLAPLWSFSYTFTAQDQGVHVFQVALTQEGTQFIVASASGVLSGLASTTVSATASVLTQLQVVTPEQAVVGTASSVTVQALDASGLIMQNFTGTVTLATSDTAATGLPSSYTFTTSDQGQHTFQVTFGTADAAGATTTVTATAGAITGQGAVTVIAASGVTSFSISTMPSVYAGSSWTLLVEALNASGQVVTNYTGTVSFTSSDLDAQISTGGTKNALPFTYTFTAADQGMHLFYVSFATPGQQSLTVTDTTTQVSASANVLVNALPAYSPLGQYLGSYGWL